MRGNQVRNTAPLMSFSPRMRQPHSSFAYGPHSNHGAPLSSSADPWLDGACPPASAAAEAVFALLDHAASQYVPPRQSNRRNSTTIGKVIIVTKPFRDAKLTRLFGKSCMIILFLLILAIAIALAAKFQTERTTKSRLDVCRTDTGNII